ncbi:MULTISPECIES: hypothetical protein [Streptomyces]|uniref:Uncharacterized protein n=1 Tax=Streptomyces sudanensis TaxID=436397 RepID=A0ABY4TE95_9ACTN|nr:MULTISPECIES: hypothetical protein [Streptomyces]MCP9957420.1 hypothetical protein [Streptomyces sudanensis]MCP9986563.1 hypothetical protein [Streptomyces sudanensis]MCQ0002032.1 hypothetical protein [Streptomyces sudanensis]URN15122.1 hypothetical protein MW084_03270 [Streptomyces sudanensis]
MAVRKRIVVLATLLGALCGSAVTVGATLVMSEDDVVSVESHTTEPPVREDYIRQWEAALARSGKKLPADIDQMTDREIFEAMWSESRKYIVPERPPTVLVD